MSESLINLVNIKDMLTSYCFTYIAVIIQRIRFYWVVKKNWGSNNSGNTWCVASGPYFLCVSWLFFLFLYFFKLIYEVDFVLTVYIWKPRSEAIKVIRTHCFLNQNTWYIYASCGIAIQKRSWKLFMESVAFIKVQFTLCFYLRRGWLPGYGMFDTVLKINIECL